MVAVSATTIWFHTIDRERPNEGFSAGRPFPFKVGSSQDIEILTSVHGLVCVGITKIRIGRRNGLGKYSDLILWNPATGDHKTLSKPFARYYDDCYTIDESLFGLYHSSWDDDYKLLGVTLHSNVYIYSLKSDSWKKVVSDLQRIRTYYSLPFSWRPNSLTFTSENELWRMDGDGNWTKVQPWKSSSLQAIKSGRSLDSINLSRSTKLVEDVTTMTFAWLQTSIHQMRYGVY
ncbi:hypothetical protein L1887_38897 [Cichorium endivia]|nr:hypothetical protein L1887_38897 [Cichorium endivia]